LVTAHEFGHNWGAVHDDFSSECSPSYSQGGSFIMHTFAVSGYDANNNFMALDICCTSNCRFRADAQCSPKNVPCCSNECHFLPATHLCLHENPMQCKHSSYCTGKSGECPQPQPIEDGRECVEEGECLNGRCLTFCERPSINKKPCICRKGTHHFSFLS
uniref:ADAM 17-like protease (inferred by orthology to a D. melanogaster protein) n=1 Tax=Anisakis simplex TaxID=6269 RepID=A0A0M3KI71_ANISI